MTTQPSFASANTWKIRLFPNPVGSTASRSPPVKSCFTEDFCSCCNSRLNPRSARKVRALLMLPSNASSPSAMLGSVDLWTTLVNNISLEPKQSRAPFAGERVIKILEFVCKCFLPSSPPLSFFALAPFFARLKLWKSRSSDFFCSDTPRKLHGNACYAGYTLCPNQSSWLQGADGILRRPEMKILDLQSRTETSIQKNWSSLYQHRDYSLFPWEMISQDLKEKESQNFVSQKSLVTHHGLF